MPPPPHAAPRPPRLLGLLAALALALATPLAPAGSPAHAMTVAPAPLAALVAEADLVVQGRVLWTLVEPVAARPWASRTRATIAIWRVYKDALAGAASRAPAGPNEQPPRATRDLVDVLLPGGTRAGLTTRVPGVPTLRPGEDLLLLLQAMPDGFAPVGYSLGVRRLPRVGQRPARLCAPLRAALEAAL